MRQQGPRPDGLYYVIKLCKFSQNLADDIYFQKFSAIYIHFGDIFYQLILDAPYIERYPTSMC